MLMVADKMPQTSESISVISKSSFLDHHSVYDDAGRKRPQTSNPFFVISKLSSLDHHSVYVDGGR